MSKHASKSSHFQLVDRPETVTVQVPFAMLGVLANAENAFFDLCVDVGQQAFSVPMEQDRDGHIGLLRLRPPISMSAATIRRPPEKSMGPSGRFHPAGCKLCSRSG